LVPKENPNGDQQQKQPSGKESFHCDPAVKSGNGWLRFG
jgi:hypothetical protein